MFSQLGCSLGDFNADEYSALAASQQQALMGGPTDQVQAMFDTVDSLSFILSYWEDMLDAQQITITIRNEI